MIIDARELPDSHVIDADLCIVGAGAAGITLARELNGQGLRVWLLESGGFEPDEEIQSLYRGENRGLPYPSLEYTRLRFFGGTTNHWAGWCRPPPARAFRSRSWIPDSGWPFSRESLTRYFERAHVMCDLGPYEYEPEYWGDAGGGRALEFKDGELETVVTQFSPPVRFGERYRHPLARAADVNVCLHANVVRIDTDEAGRSVTALQAAALRGPRFTVRPRYCVLATGGIENARLMLDSDHVMPGGIGNSNDLVGRYFMDHIKSEVARFQPGDPRLDLGFYLRHVRNGVPLKGNLRFSDEVLRRERILESYFELFPAEDPPGGSISESVARVITSRSSPGTVPSPGWRVMLRLDPAPNPDSRLTLSRETDALGQRRGRLDWRFGDLEQRSFDRAGQALARAVGRSGLGRLRLKEGHWPPAPEDITATGFHHMGTTRMHVDPKRGVVDPDCRVHGMSNLYVAGSSIFPTYEGYPTMTLVALTLRLAEHLKELFK